jgi:hypothetical protein
MEHVNFALRAQQLETWTVVTQRQQLERQLHLLLPTVLLHHAAALPVDHPGFPELCYVIGQTSSTALAAWEQLRPLLLVAATSTARGARYCPPDMELSQLLRLGCTLSASLQQRVAAAAPGDAAVAARAAAAGLGAAGQATAAAAAKVEVTRIVKMCKVVVAHLVDCMCKVVSPAVHGHTVFGSGVSLDAVLAAMREAGAVGGSTQNYPQGWTAGCLLQQACATKQSR